MRSTTGSEGEQKPASVFASADQEQARRQRVQNLLESMERCSQEAAANGLTEEILADILELSPSERRNLFGI